ncbi:MAG TPA: hypothetical protein VGY66_31415 [Gemmataceae bacterium]|jgi:hypothetical protein|nr:hypothetical protein [Gemmataceae bacterium]
MNRLRLIATATPVFLGAAWYFATADSWAQPAPAAGLLKPHNLAALNTPLDEDDPYLTRDGVRLLYTSNASKHFTLLESYQRNPARSFPGSEKWPAGVELEGQSADSDNRSPFLTADNHDLYYAEKTLVKGQAGESQAPANFEIAHAIRLTRPTQFTGPTYVQAVCTEADELAPWLTDDGLEMYFSRKTRDGWRVFVSRRPPPTKKEPKGAFGEPELIKELPVGFHHVTIPRSNLVMYLQGPLENNRWGLFRVKRRRVKEPWGKPEALERLNHPDAPTGDMSPCVSHDGTKLYFSSDRPGGKGGRDLWVIETRWFN